MCVRQKQYIITTFSPSDFFSPCLILQSSLKTVEKHIVWSAAFLPAACVYFDSCHGQCVNSKGVYSVKTLNSFTTVGLSLFFDWKSEYFGSYLHFQKSSKWTLYTVDGSKIVSALCWESAFLQQPVFLRSSNYLVPLTACKRIVLKRL